MSAKVLKFLQIVGSQFAKRHASSADEKVWLDSMIQGLGSYDASVLERAAHRIILSKTDPGFPYLAECRKACEEIIKLEKADRAPKFDEAARQKAHINSADWKKKLADDLVMCPLGKQAAQEGWILSLHDFAMEHGRLPSGHEIDGYVTPTRSNRLPCKQAAKVFDQVFEEVLNGRGGVLAGPLEKLGDSMRTRRFELTEMVLGGKK